MAVQESQLQKDKIRVYVLARELNIDTKELLEICKQAGLDVKNQLSSIDPDQKEMIEQLVKKGAHKAQATPARAAGPAALPDVNKPIRNLATRPAARREPEPVRATPPNAAPAPASPPPASSTPVVAPPTPPAPVAPEPVVVPIPPPQAVPPEAAASTAPNTRATPQTPPTVG